MNRVIEFLILILCIGLACFIVVLAVRSDSKDSNNPKKDKK